MDAPTPQGVGRDGGGRRDGGQNPGRGSREGRNPSHHAQPPPRHVSYGNEAHGSKRRSKSFPGFPGAAGRRGSDSQTSEGTRKRTEGARSAKAGQDGPSPRALRASKRREGRAEPMSALREAGDDSRSAAQFHARAATTPQGGAAGQGTPHHFGGPQRLSVLSVVGPRRAPSTGSDDQIQQQPFTQGRRVRVEVPPRPDRMRGGSSWTVPHATRTIHEAKP